MEVNNSNSFSIDRNQVANQSASIPVDCDCIQKNIRFSAP